MLLAPMDGNVIYRCGVDFIAVRLTNSACGCCAYVHIDNYRRKLAALVTSTNNVRYAYLQAPSMLAIGTGLVFVAHVAAQVLADRCIGSRRACTN